MDDDRNGVRPAVPIEATEAPSKVASSTRLHRVGAGDRDLPARELPALGLVRVRRALQGHLEARGAGTSTAAPSPWDDGVSTYSTDQPGVPVWASSNTTRS